MASLMSKLRSTRVWWKTFCLESSQIVSHQESLEAKVNETKAMGVAIGNCSMEEKQVFQNVQLMQCQLPGLTPEEELA
ncbi:hypothetical protein QQ045_020446 [Rhodiola kirilowii]